MLLQKIRQCLTKIINQKFVFKHSSFRASDSAIRNLFSPQLSVDSYQFTGLPVHQSTVISLQLSVTSSPVYQFTSSLVHLSPLTTNSSLRLNRVLDTMALVYRHKPITRTDRNYLLFHHYTNTPFHPLRDSCDTESV